jgi:hypothetical protein
MGWQAARNGDERCARLATDRHVYEKVLVPNGLAPLQKSSAKAETDAFLRWMIMSLGSADIAMQSLLTRPFSRIRPSCMHKEMPT